MGDTPVPATVRLSNSQGNSADVIAYSTLETDGFANYAVNQGLAAGNMLNANTNGTLQGGADAGTGANSGELVPGTNEQWNTGQVVVSLRTAVDSTNLAATEATALGNSAAAQTYFSNGAVSSSQENWGGVAAVNDIEANGVYGIVSATTTAMGNNVQTGGFGPQIDSSTTTRQVNGANITAATTVRTGFANGGIATSTTAIGNNAQVVTGW